MSTICVCVFLWCLLLFSYFQNKASTLEAIWGRHAVRWVGNRWLLPFCLRLRHLKLTHIPDTVNSYTACYHLLPPGAVAGCRAVYAPLKRHRMQVALNFPRVHRRRGFIIIANRPRNGGNDASITLQPLLLIKGVVLMFKLQPTMHTLNANKTNVFNVCSA